MVVTHKCILKTGNADELLKNIEKVISVDQENILTQQLKEEGQKSSRFFEIKEGGEQITM